ncbi:MAG: DNA cytosine methyltransferase [Actinobacteria bacterium]|nr:DNA cytosine methyltransferase [Actinomycetota bacterium]
MLDRHKPRYLLVENVPNLLRHDEGRTWKWPAPGFVDTRLS